MREYKYDIMNIVCVHKASLHTVRVRMEAYCSSSSLSQPCFLEESKGSTEKQERNYGRGFRNMESSDRAREGPGNLSRIASNDL